MMRSHHQLFYDHRLKNHSRHLRKGSTDAEIRLWARIRRKQLFNLQFYRQRIIGEYIVDFYCPKAKLIIELDGGQHFFNENIEKDKKRDFDLEKLGFRILRFADIEVLRDTDSVLEKIVRYL